MKKMWLAFTGATARHDGHYILYFMYFFNLQVGKGMKSGVLHEREQLPGMVDTPNCT
jgi:hypothetical protein